jgi:prephenate dehydrogenase
VKPLAQQTVAVVGLGLMGGSLAAALRGHCEAVVGVARRRETLDEALRREMIDRGTLDLGEALQDAGVVVLATPVRTVLSLVRQAGRFLGEGSLLMDLGSTKREIVRAMASLPSGIQPLGGHPMCGKERSGLAAADPALYRGARFVLTPLARTSAEAIVLGQELAHAAGALPLVMDAAAHDRKVAITSHVPYVLSAALLSAAVEASGREPGLWPLAAGGFRDMTRLAGSDPRMVLDIMLTNRDNVLAGLDLLQARLSEFGALLRRGDEGGLAERISGARQRFLEVRR